MKRMFCLLLVIGCLHSFNLAYAATDKQTAPTTSGASTTTHFAAPYPTEAATLPPLPSVPASMEDAKAVAAYIAATDAFLKAAQNYINAAGNDVNFIIKERNAAIEHANKAVADYNAFFKIEPKK